MAIKYFDIERLVRIPRPYDDSIDDVYICFDDIIGVCVNGEYVTSIYTVGVHFSARNWKLSDFEAEVERAIKKTMADQNENLNEFQNELHEKLEAAKMKSLFNKTDKISDAN